MSCLPAWRSIAHSISGGETPEMRYVAEDIGVLHNRVTWKLTQIDT